MMKILSDLRTWLDNTASKIAGEEENPEGWDTPLIFLLEALENEAERKEGNNVAYEKMLYKVRDSIDDWFEDRTWGY